MSAIKANQVLNLDGDRIGSVVVDSIANMKNLNPEIEANATVELLGYYSKGDGGGGTFYWDSTSIEDDNGGTIIEATGVVDGRWIRNYSGAVNVKWFGAVGDGVTDDTVAIQNAIDSLGTSGGELYIPKGTYKVTNIVISNIKTVSLRGTGATTILFAGATDSWGLTVESAGTFGIVRISDIDFTGVEGTVNVNGIHSRLINNSEFRNLTFKWLKTCIRGENLYASTFDNIYFDEYEIGIRGLTDAEAIDKGYPAAGNAPLADCIFINMDFWDGSNLVPASYALWSTGFNSNTFNTCIFGGVHSDGIDMRDGYGGCTFTHCRFERMKANVSWIKLGSFNYFYNCVAYTDGGNCWCTIADPVSDTWLFDISGQGNYIDGISPEYPRHIIKLRPGSRNNEVTWIPAQSNGWLSSDYFLSPIMDFGIKNNVKIRDFDRIVNNIASTDGPVLNMLVKSNDQSVFGLDGLTKIHTPTQYSKGPYKNESVYEYSAPTGNRRAIALVPGLTSGYWYTFSMWVATNNFASIEAIEIILGEESFGSESYAPFIMDASQKWVRVSKTFQASSTDLYCGFRMSASATANLYVSQPQLVECGATEDSIFIGGYVPTTDSLTQVLNPTVNTARNLVDKTSARAIGATYTNTSGKEITVYVTTYSNTNNANCTVYINGLAVSAEQSPIGLNVSLMFPVKPGETYSVDWSTSPVLVSWYENI